MTVVPSHWGNRAALALVLSEGDLGGVDPLDAAVIAGRVIRSTVGSSDERRELRARVSELLTSERLPALDQGWHGPAEAFGELFDDCATEGRPSVALLLSLLWLRDDVESVRAALATARLSTLQDEAGALEAVRQLNAVLDDVDEWCSQVDAAAANRLEGWRRVLVTSSFAKSDRASLEALSRLVSCAENAWWLDLVDPLLLEAGKGNLPTSDTGEELVGTVAAAAAPTRVSALGPSVVQWRRRPSAEPENVLRVAAAGRDVVEGVVEDYELENGVKLRTFLDARQHLRVQVWGLQGDGPFEVYWDGPAEGAARLEPIAELWTCELPKSFAGAEHVGVRRAPA